MADRRWIPRIGVGIVFGWLALLPATAFGQLLAIRAFPLFHRTSRSTRALEPGLRPGPAGRHVLQEQPGPVRGLVQRMWGYVDPDNAEIISVHQLACLIDHLDKSLFCRGQVVVKNPDVWGQNRLTEYRVEYENQMKPAQ